MPSTECTRDEVSRRGREIYEQRVRPELSTSDEGRHIVVDIVSGEYVLADSALAAARTALARHPDAVLFGMRIGSPTAYHLSVVSPMSVIENERQYSTNTSDRAPMAESEYAEGV